MLGSIDATIKITNILLKGLPHVPHLDIAEGILIRLDMCYNHQVGDMVNDYIEAMGNLSIHTAEQNTTVLKGWNIAPKHITTKFYNKEHESGFVEAKGILRQETTIAKRQRYSKILGESQSQL